MKLYASVCGLCDVCDSRTHTNGSAPHVLLSGAKLVIQVIPTYESATFQVSHVGLYLLSSLHIFGFG